MTIIIVGETHIHCDRISLADGHMIECPSKIVTGPDFAWGFCGYAPSPKMEIASTVDELVAAYKEEVDLRMGNGDQILLSHGGNLWHGGYSQKEGGGFFLTRTHVGSAIGSYATEWRNFRGSCEGLSLPIDRAANAFVRRLSRLWGSESRDPCVSVPLF
jgi:hypothetical protein